jgi:hypothetical protein
VIQHEMGRRWSLYFEKLFRFVFTELSLPNAPEFEVTDNVIAFKVTDYTKNGKMLFKPC